MKMNRSTPREKAPEGVHQAVCYGFADIGTHVSPVYGKAQRKCYLFFEFAKLRLKDGSPMVQSGNYTLSLGDLAKLYKHLKSWKGRAITQEERNDFDSSMLIGKGCMLQIIHSDDGEYANIETILPLAEGLPMYDPENETFDYELTPGYVPDNMREGEPYAWLGNKIKASEEWNETVPEQKDTTEPF